MGFKIVNEKLICFDIGAAGVVPENWLKFSDQLRVFAFDARPGSIRTPYKSNTLDLRKIETAVGGKTVKSRTLYVTKRPTGSSFYKINPCWAERLSESAYYDLVETKQLSVRTLSDVIQKDGIDLPDFIKLDIQGAEFETLEALNPIHQQNLMGLLIEVEFLPIYENQPLFTDVHQLMSKMGFILYDMRTHRSFASYNDEDFGWYKNFTAYQRPSSKLSALLYSGDALYIRDFHKRPPKSEMEVRKLTLVLLMHNYFDFAWIMVEKAKREGIIREDLEKSLKQSILGLVPKPNRSKRKGLISKLADKFWHVIGLGQKQPAGWAREKWPSQ